MDQTKKRTRPKKTELQKAIELGLKYPGLHAIKTKDFEILFTPQNISNNQLSQIETKARAKVNAAGIEINGEIPKEEIQNEEDFLFWSTPTYQIEKELMNGEALEQANQ